jgi:hypothetical protein
MPWSNSAAKQFGKKASGNKNFRSAFTQPKLSGNTGGSQVSKMKSGGARGNDAGGFKTEQVQNGKADNPFQIAAKIPKTPSNSKSIYQSKLPSYGKGTNR